jgi:hypothetical protein
MFVFLLFWAFCGSFYLGAWFCFVGMKRIYRGGVLSNGAVLILLGVGLLFVCRVSFMGWYHQVN